MTYGAFPRSVRDHCQCQLGPLVPPLWNMLTDPFATILFTNNPFPPSHKNTLSLTVCFANDLMQFIDCKGLSSVFWVHLFMPSKAYITLILSLRLAAAAKLFKAQHCKFLFSSLYCKKLWEEELCINTTELSQLYLKCSLTDSTLAEVRRISLINKVLFNRVNLPFFTNISNSNYMSLISQHTYFLESMWGRTL